MPFRGIPRVQVARKCDALHAWLHQAKKPGIALDTESPAPGTMNALTFCYVRSSKGASDMNPSQCTQPDQLFGACMHAGGWPKLGWETQDGDDEDMTCYEEVEA